MKEYLRHGVLTELLKSDILKHEGVTGFRLHVAESSDDKAYKRGRVDLHLTIGNGFYSVSPTGPKQNLILSLAIVSPYENDAPYEVRNGLRELARMLENNLRIEGEDADRGIPQYPIGRIAARVGDRLELEDGNDILGFHIGQSIVAAHEDGGEPYHTLRGGRAQVVAVDFGESTITIAPEDGISGLASLDYLFQELT